MDAISGIVTATKFVGDGSGLTNYAGGGSYGNNDVENHLNVSAISSSGQILSWNGSDYAWVNDQTGGGGGGTDVGITTNLSGSFTASAGTPATINTFTHIMLMIRLLSILYTLRMVVTSNHKNF